MCKCVCVSAARARASRVRLSGDCGCVSGREGPKTETESGPEMCSRRRLAPQNRSGPSKAAAKEMPPKKAKGGTAASGDAKSPKKKDSPSRKSSSRNSSRKVQDESVYLANATAPALPPSAPLPTTTESGPSVAELTRRVDELTRSMRAAGDREDYATALELQAERNALRVRLEELRLFGPVDADNFLERERRRVAAVLAVEAFEAAEADLEKAYGMDHARDPTILPYSMCSSNATRSAASYGVGPIEAVRATKPRAGAVPVASVPVARPRMAASEDEYYSVPVASGGWNERLNKLAGLAEDFSDTHATATPDLDELLRKMADGHLLTIAELEALERFQAEEEEEEEECVAMTRARVSRCSCVRRAVEVWRRLHASSSTPPTLHSQPRVREPLRRRPVQPLQQRFLAAAEEAQAAAWVCRMEVVWSAVCVCLKRCS